MSAVAMSTVWENPKFGGMTLLVLLSIADWCDHDGVTQVNLIGVADHARTTPDAVHKILERLRRNGDINYWPVKGITHETMLDVRIPMEVAHER